MADARNNTCGARNKCARCSLFIALLRNYLSPCFSPICLYLLFVKREENGTEVRDVQTGGRKSTVEPLLFDPDAFLSLSSTLLSLSRSLLSVLCGRFSLLSGGCSLSSVLPNIWFLDRKKAHFADCFNITTNKWACIECLPLFPSLSRTRSRTYTYV